MVQNTRVETGALAGASALSLVAMRKLGRLSGVSPSSSVQLYFRNLSPRVLYRRVYKRPTCYSAADS